MNLSASAKPINHLFHDCGYIYISTIEPKINEPLTVRLRAEKGNLTRAYVEISQEGTIWESFPLQREKEDSTGFFEYFIGTIPGQEKMFKYRFHVGNDNPDNDVYYARTYIGKNAPVFDDSDCTKPDNLWTIVPGLHTPDWAKGILWYSLMPDAFYNGDITNDETISGDNYPNPWNEPQHTLFYKYGGDLKGIEKKLDYIKSLGCEAIFMNPIFKAKHNAGYGPQFYKQIENSMGNREEFETLARLIHEKGLYYMIDVVLTFVDPNHPWYNINNKQPLPGAFADWNSPYHDFFYFNGEDGDTSAYGSAWGDGVSLNWGNDDLCDKIYRQEDSYLQYYCSSPFNVDAIRFDCGGALSGTTPSGKKLNDVAVMGDMRSYLKEINPELMLLSEYSFYNAMDSGSWDSRWNISFCEEAEKYMRGELTESYLYHRFDTELHNVPRAIGLCEYNSITDHDVFRPLGIAPYAYRAYQLLHMTELGSPCLYYGDEVKLERENGTFYAMEWDESNWNYKVLNETKALIELRKTYSALRNGIEQFICADDEKHILSYARIDENGTVITAASRNAAQMELVIDTIELGEPDGTIFTDWFTGQQYTAVNGSIAVILPAGGTILVKGRESSLSKGGFHATRVKEGTAITTIPKANALSICGDAVYMNRDVFNTCTVSALCKADNATGILLISSDTQSDSAFICASVSGSNLTVYARSSVGEAIKDLAHASIAPASYIKISRDAHNAFCVYASRTAYGVWDEILANVHVDIPNHAKAGMVASDGMTQFEDISVEYQKETILFDDFSYGNSAMFDFTPDMTLKYSDHTLSLIPQSDHSELLTNSHDEDWTFKTRLTYQATAEGDYAGVISKQDDSIFVIAGRMLLHDKPAFFLGKAANGTLIVYQTVTDTMPDKDVTIQLQRIGSVYSAIYTYDENIWHPIGKELFANLCLERVGLVTHGQSIAAYHYASFGNAIHDGISFNTPKTPRAIDTSFAAMANTLTESAYKIIAGDWSCANEGYVQTSLSRAQLAISNKQYSDFKVDGTYWIEEGDGFIGFEFGKAEPDSALGDGILFMLRSDRTIALVKDHTILKEAALPSDIGDEVKLSVEMKHNTLAVYAGQNSEPFLISNDLEPVTGYISYFTEGIVGHLNNFYTASYDANYFYAGTYDYFTFTDNSVEKNMSDRRGFINPYGVGVTDFCITAKFRVKEYSPVLPESHIGFYLCAPEGKYNKNDHLAVIFSREHTLQIKSGKNTLASMDTDPERTSWDITIRKANRTLSVYLDHSDEPVLECTDVTPNGGVVSFCGINASFILENLEIEDLNP